MSLEAKANFWRVPYYKYQNIQFHIYIQLNLHKKVV